MTNTTQLKTGTVTINGRTYTHKTRDGCYAREVDLLIGGVNCPRKFAILEGGKEKVFSYTDQLKYHPSGHTCDADLSPLPATITRTRPRELKDVVAELAKGGVPWVKYPEAGGWFISTLEITEKTVERWNGTKALFSRNPFSDKEPLTIIGPEITEEIKPCAK